MVYYSHARANRACIVHLAPYHIGCPEPKGEKMGHNLEEYKAAASKRAEDRTPHEKYLMERARAVGMKPATNIDHEVNGKWGLF